MATRAQYNAELQNAVMLDREDYKSAKWIVQLKTVAMFRQNYVNSRNESVLAHAASRVGRFKADPIPDLRLNVELSHGDLVRLTRLLNERVTECEREAGREERRGHHTTAKIWMMDAVATNSLLIRIRSALK